MDSGIAFFDGDMKYLEYNQNGSEILFTDEKYSDMFSVTIQSKSTLILSMKRSYGKSQLEVIFDEEKFLGLKGAGGRIIRDIPETQMPERFKGLETSFSRRGYMWFVCLSRLDEVIFIGSGPDNFLYWFNQHDIIGKLNLLHDTSILVDKPHNLYLHIAVSTGLLSLFAYLALVGTFVISTFRALGLRRKKTFYEFIGTGIVAGVIGYLGASLFVDSTIGVTTVFYLILGIGIYVTQQIKREKLVR
jgi:hypothetical protein